MSWLAISGIDLSSIIALGEEPKADRRDIGDVTDANDGSKRATRTARKYDFSGRSIPLSKADAFAWESLITGAGNVWRFDSTFKFYSSKGIAAIASDTNPLDTFVQSSVKKFASAVETPGGESFTTAGLGIVGSIFTQSVWCRVGAGAFHHYVLRGDGAIWVDGVRNDAANTPLQVAGSEAFLDASLIGGGTQYFEDWVVTPYLWPVSWPPLVYANNALFSLLPYLTCAGDLVPEAATRKMIGKCAVSGIIKANPGSGMSKVMQKLQIELLGA
jgi:hypothetical protein